MTDFLESSYPSGSERSQFFCSWIRHITVNYKKWNRQDMEIEGTNIKYTALLCILSLILNVILFIKNCDFSDESFISCKEVFINETWHSFWKSWKRLWCYTFIIRKVLASLVEFSNIDNVASCITQQHMNFVTKGWLQKQL